MLNNNEFGAKIADLRKEKGLTQAQLADLLNISNKTISRWETGEGYPEITLLSPLAKALGVTVDELLAEPVKEMGDDESKPDSDDSHISHNNGSKPKKHKEIPVEWPEINIKEFFRRPMVIINILQCIFFITFSCMTFSCCLTREITPDKWNGIEEASSGSGLFCSDNEGYIILTAMILFLVLLSIIHLRLYKSSKISRSVLIRNTVLSLVYASGIFLNYSFVQGKSGYHTIGGNTDTIIFEYAKGNFFHCDFFKVDRQFIIYVFVGVALIYLILEIIRIKRLKKEQKSCSDISESNNAFWKSLTIFNKIGFICMMVCVAAPFVGIIITVVTQSFIISLTESAVAFTPAIILTFISITPKIGLIIAAIGLILGACDLYDRQYKVSIIIIGANLILPYIISFLSVILFIYPFQTLFN